MVRGIERLSFTVNRNPDRIAMTDPHVVEDQSEIVAFLTDPASHGGALVERIDTHGAMVFLAGDRAYKLKRAVHYPYMDFSTVARREAACRAELRVNRRTAPQIYLGVEPVRRRADGTLALGCDEGTVLDWLVVMRRFDQEALFDRMAERDALTPSMIEDLADHIVALHAAADRHTDAAAETLRQVIRGNLDDLREEPAVFDPETVAMLTAAVHSALDATAQLRRRRAREGLVRHCHGDLHLRNVVLLPDGPTLFDAIEFNESLAIIDVLYDFAFLLVDLDFEGRRGLANRALNRYLAATLDYDGLAVLPIFLSTRAMIRAKVLSSVAANLGDETAAADQRRLARRYLDLALAYLRPPPPQLVAIGGLSGVGKTTLARGLAPTLGPTPGAVVLRSDVIRKRMLGRTETETLDSDAYTAEITDRVFAEMVIRAERALVAGHAVIADAVYAMVAQRSAIAEAARRAEAPFRGLWLTAPLELRLARVDARANDASDAGLEIAELQEKYDVGPVEWSAVDAAGFPEAVIAKAREALAAATDGAAPVSLTSP